MHIFYKYHQIFQKNLENTKHRGKPKLVPKGPIKNSDFPADSSPNLYIVTCHFFILIQSRRLYLKFMEARFKNFQKINREKCCWKLDDHFLARFPRNPLALLREFQKLYKKKLFFFFYFTRVSTRVLFLNFNEAVIKLF